MALVRQHWQRTALVLYSSGLEVLDEVEEVFTGHGAAFGMHNNGLGVRRSLVIDTRTLYKDKMGKLMHFGSPRQVNLATVCVPIRLDFTRHSTSCTAALLHYGCENPFVMTFHTVEPLANCSLPFLT